MNVKRYSKSIGTGLAGAIATILITIFGDRLPAEQAMALAGGIVAVISVYGAYRAPKNDD